MSCASCHRHSNLISNVYPTAPGEEGPKSAALSLLVFYSSSKPQKLPKIGVFLEAKIEKDIGNSRYSHVAVTLAIITAILKDCQQHVSLFSKNVLRIILRVLNCTEQSVIKPAIETFILLTTIRNQEDGIDTEFSLVHKEVVLKLSREAVKEHASGENDQVKWRYCALNALEALCERNYFVDGSKIDDTTSQVMEAILKNIIYTDTPDPVLKGGRASIVSQTQVPTMNPTQITQNGVVSSSTATNGKMTASDLSKLAVKCLTEVIRNSNAITLKALLNDTFRILESSGELEDALAALFLFPLFVSSSETQYHFVIITNVLEKLSSETRVPVKTTLVKIIRYLILSEKLAGLTIPELLDIFVYHLSESAKLTTPLGSKESVVLMAMQIAFTRAIGSLAVHLAYPNQINEIIGFLVNRTQFGKQVTKLTTIEEKYLVYLLMGLAEVLKLKDFNFKSKSGSKSRHSFVPTMVGYDLLIPIIPFFESNSLDLRVEVYNVCKAAVAAGITCRRLEPFEEFFATLLPAVSLYGSNQGNKPVDYVLLAKLMMSMVTINNPNAFGQMLPVLFYLQKNSSFFPEAQKRALATVTVDFLLWVAKFLELSKFDEYMEKIKSNRISSNEWCPSLTTAEETVDILRPLSFNDVEANANPKPVTLLLNEEEIKDIVYMDLLEKSPEGASILKEIWGKDFSMGGTSQFTNLIPKSESGIVHAKVSTSGPKISAARKIVAVITDSSDKPESKPASIVQQENSQKGLPTVSELDAIEAVHSDSVPGVLDILKSITDTFGSPPSERKSVVSREHSADVAGKLDRDLDFLRSRTKSNTNTNSGPPSPEKIAPPTRPLSPDSTLRSKLREPAIFDM